MLLCYIYLRQLKCFSYKRTTHLSWTSNVPSSILEGASSSNENASVTSRNPSHVFHPVLLPMSAQKDGVSLPVNACNTANDGGLYRHKVAAIVCAAMYLWCTLHQMLSRLHVSLECFCCMSWSNPACAQWSRWRINLVSASLWVHVSICILYPLIGAVSTLFTYVLKTCFFRKVLSIASSANRGNNYVLFS